MTSKSVMVLYNLAGHRQHHDVIDAVPLLAEKLHVNVLLLQFQYFFIKVLIEVYGNLSNKLNFSGPGCSKLTTSLVNETLKFQTLISQICQYFC